MRVRVAKFNLEIAIYPEDINKMRNGIFPQSGMHRGKENR